VRNPSYRKEGRLKPGEMVELQKTLASYGDRVGSSASGSRRARSEATMRAAGAGQAGLEHEEPRSNGAPKKAPVEHYDDLEADEIVTLVDSLEEEDLGSLLEYEQGHLARPRVISAIEGVRTRRQAGPRP
jgi:hypothetical protein